MQSTGSLLFAAHIRDQLYKKRPQSEAFVFYGRFVDAGIPS